MEFKGTKGEWSVEKELGYDCDVIYKGGEICWLGLSDVIDEEKVANAKLIAAAPELLKALQILLNLTTTLKHPSIDFANGTAREAINKALK
jgi:hypothetical protein